MWYGIRYGAFRVISEPGKNQIRVRYCCNRYFCFELGFTTLLFLYAKDAGINLVAHSLPRQRLIWRTVANVGSTFVKFFASVFEQPYLAACYAYMPL